MHVAYIPENIDYWIDFYKGTIKCQKQYQLGGDLRGFRAYAPYHRGGGLGSFFKSLFRMVMPTLKSVGKEALYTSSKIAADMADGQSLSDSARKHGKAVAGKMMHQVADKLQSGTGLGRRKTVPVKKSNKRRNKSIPPSVCKKKLPRTVRLDYLSDQK